MCSKSGQIRRMDKLYAYVVEGAEELPSFHDPFLSSEAFARVVASQVRFSARLRRTAKSATVCMLTGGLITQHPPRAGCETNQHQGDVLRHGDLCQRIGCQRVMMSSCHGFTGDPGYGGTRRVRQVVRYHSQCFRR